MIGRRGNGQFVSASASLDAELARVEGEITATERAGLPLEDRIAAAEAELGRCETHYRTHGFSVVGTGPQEREHYRHLAMVGALLTIGRDALLAAERQRVSDQFEAGGGFGLSPADKAARLGELRNRQRQLLARFEQSLRAQEGEGALVIHAKRSAELFLLSDGDLERIANGHATEITA